MRILIIPTLILVLLITSLMVGSASTLQDVSEIPQPQWSKTYLGLGGQVIQTSDDGYAISGTNASILFYPATERAPILLKTDPSGEVQWKKTFGNGNAGVNSIIQTSDGGFALSGSNIAPTILNPVYSSWLIKLDS